MALTGRERQKRGRRAARSKGWKEERRGWRRPLPSYLLEGLGEALVAVKVVMENICRNRETEGE